LELKIIHTIFKCNTRISKSWIPKRRLFINIFYRNWKTKFIVIPIRRKWIFWKCKTTKKCAISPQTIFVLLYCNSNNNILYFELPSNKAYTDIRCSVCRKRVFHIFEKNYNFIVLIDDGKPLIFVQQNRHRHIHTHTHTLTNTYTHTYIYTICICVILRGHYYLCIIIMLKFLVTA